MNFFLLIGYNSRFLSTFVAKLCQMYRMVLLLVFVVAFPLLGNAQRKRALLVGISNYRTNGYRLWRNIHGAEDVALLTPELRKKGYKVEVLINEQATYQGIINTLSRFIERTKKGDMVYLQFSCHGQPVEDGLNGRGKDEDDGWDEALVPIDAGKTYHPQGYKGEKHITDDQLKEYILRLRERIGARGVLYVVIDACHAGNMERDDFETIRGTNEGLTSNPGNKYNPPDKGKRSKPEKAPGLSPVLYVEACESFQRNQEIVYQGRQYGALSFNIWQTLCKMSSFPQDWQVFMNHLSRNITANKERHNRLWPGTQTVVFEY